MKLKSRVLYLTLLLSFVAVKVLPNSIDEYKKITKNGKFGLQNVSTNQVVIPPTFDDIGWSDNSIQVINGVIGFKLNETWGLIDLEQNRIVKSQYTILQPFTNGLLIVGKRSKTSILNEYGVINTTGKILKPLQFQNLLASENNLIGSKKINGQIKVGLLNSSLKTILPFKFNSIQTVSNNLFSVGNNDGLKALFDSKGIQKSQFKYETINALGEKYLLISLYNRKGLMDLEGNTITDPIYKEIRIEKDVYIASSFAKWTLLDADNKTLKSYYFDQVYPLSDASFVVQTNNDTGIINEDEDYLNYLQDLSIIGSKHGLSIVKRGKYVGVVNSSGKIIIPLLQDSVWLGENFILGKVDNKNGQSWRPFDNAGNRIGYLDYEEFERESFNRFRAKRNGKWGLLNNFGEEVSPFSFDELGHFKNGLATVVYLNNYGVINENGDWIVTPYKDNLTLLDQRIIYQQGTENGIMDHTGKVLYRSQNKIEALGQFFIEKNRDSQYILLNPKGNRALLEPVDTIYYASPSLFIFQKNKKWEMLNAENMKVIKLKDNIEHISGMSEGHIMAFIEGHWGFIGEDGRLSIANRYDSLQFYSEGLAAVNLIGKWGYIDQQENLDIQPTYDFAYPFHENLSIVKQNGFYGVIDKSGKSILDIKYDKIERTKSYILLYKDGLMGLANSKGELHRSVQYNSIASINATQFLVSKNKKYGVISIDGLDIIPVSYDKITPFNGKFLVMEIASKNRITLN